MVKKKPGKTGLAALKGAKTSGRISMRLHPDIKSALEFLAHHDHRTLSSYIEWLFIQHMSEMLDCHVEPDGAVVGQIALRPGARLR